MNSSRTRLERILCKENSDTTTRAKYIGKVAHSRAPWAKQSLPAPSSFIFYSHECRHSMMVVASMKYPPQRTHIRWGFSSVILILVVRCMIARWKDVFSILIPARNTASNSQMAPMYQCTFLNKSHPDNANEEHSCKPDDYNSHLLPHTSRHTEIFLSHTMYTELLLQKHHCSR